MSLRMVTPEKNGKVIKRISNPVPTIRDDFKVALKCFISLILWKIVPFLVPHPFSRKKHDMNAIFHNFFNYHRGEKKRKIEADHSSLSSIPFPLNRLAFRFYCFKYF